MKITRMDHIGIVVNDLEAAKEFFIDFGLVMDGEGGLEGELLDNVAGLKHAKTQFVWLRPPDGGTALEIIKFLAPAGEQAEQAYPSNALGIRHISFAVQDIDALVAKLRSKGVEFFSEIQNYQDIYKLCYLRGPEGMIVEIAEELK